MIVSMNYSNIFLSRNVIPLLKQFANERCPDMGFQHFHVPKYICGKIFSEAQAITSTKASPTNEEFGIIILDDLSSKGYNMANPNLMIFNLEQMTVRVY